MDKTFYLIICLVSAIVLTYFFDERKTVQTYIANEKKESFLSAYDLKNFSELKLPNLIIIRKGKYFYIKGHQFRLDNKEVNNLTMMLSNLKIKRKILNFNQKDKKLFFSKNPASFKIISRGREINIKIGKDYPLPIVDHAKARAEALNAFDKITK